MARIAGIVAAREPAARGRLLAGVLGALRRSDGWGAAAADCGDATVGWTGWLHEPGVAADEGLAVALDGRIYGEHETAVGARAAALVAELYRRHGIDGALARLNGDFALALYDGHRGELMLARDRFGVKPLYYATAPQLFGFASQPRALLGLPGVEPDVDRTFVALFAASHYRYFDNDPDRSPYEHVRQVPAAHVLTVRDGALVARRYWALADAPDLDEPEGELAERYRELLLDAVGRRARAAHRPAFTLSGGMDSSSVLGCAVRATGRRQHAFSTVYADRTYDESAEIASMLDAGVEQWHRVPVGTPDVFALVARMVEIHDEPVATATWLSHFLLCGEVSAGGFGALFGGLGGDELNAGEYEYFLYHFADLRAAGREEELTHEVELWARHHDHPVFRKNRSVVEEALVRLADLDRPGRVLPDRRRLERYAAALAPGFFDLRAFEPVLEAPFTSYLKNRTWQDLSRETAPPCLRAEDRHATAFGLDHLLPFFDHRLAELMFRVPGRLKIRDGVTKRLLREAMRGILPEETRTRIAKTGWNAPAHVWFSGAQRESLLDLVRSREFRERGIYDVREVERIVADHERIVSTSAREENHMMFLWQLVNLELWLRAAERAPVAAAQAVAGTPPASRASSAKSSA